MHIPQLMPRLDRDCPVGSSWYVCQSNGFKGCCEVDPCDLASCPSSPSTPTDDAATTADARAIKTAITTVTSPTTVTASPSSSEAVGGSTLTSDATSSTASPTQPTAPRPPGTGTGTLETPIGPTDGGAGSGATRGGIQSGDRAAQLPAGVIVGIVLAGALVILVVCALLWWRVCWRRRARRDQQSRHHARGLTWTSGPGYYGPGDDSATTTGAAAPMMGYSGVIEADCGRAAAVPASAAATPARQGSHHSHHQQSSSPPRHFSDSKGSMMVPIGMAHPCQPNITTTTATTQPGGGHARWESPDDIRWCSDANSDLVSPVSPDGGSSGPSRRGSRYAREAAPAPLLLAPDYPHQPPPQQQQQQQQHRQQADSIPKFELDGREISPPSPPHPQPPRDSSAGSPHPAPLRLGSVRTQSLRRPARLTRRASDAGHYPPDIPHQQREVAAAAPAPHSRSRSRSLSGGGGWYYAVVGQHQEQQQPPPPPPPVYSRRSSSQARGYENCRDSYNGGDVGPRATLRATRHEVETGVHAGSWSVLSPA